VDVELRKGERIDDLQYNGLRIIQNPEFFRFGCDAVELANFVIGGASDKAVDLGSGSGIIALLLAGKKNISVTAVEIQKDVAEMSERSVKLNGLEDKIRVINAPMQSIAKYLAAGSQSIVVCNPPYRKTDSGEKKTSEYEAISRYEVAITLKEVIECAAYLLKNGGKFYLINQTERLAETIFECKKHGIEPKILQILTPTSGKAPHLFMLQALKGGKEGITVNKERTVRTYC
jgi:tRNA1Val (adenine37-N6)-methyltransferase